MYFNLFLIFSNLAVVFSLVLIFCQNPIYSILSLVGCIFFSVVILFIFGVEFMGFVYLVVYIGAISILFLFIVMLLNINCINALPDSTFITRDFFLYCCLFFKGLHTFFLSNENIFIFYYEGYYSYAFNSDYYLVASIIWKSGRSSFVIHSDLIYPTFKMHYHAVNRYNYTMQHSLLEEYPNLLSSGLNSHFELASFCILYTTHFIYFIIAGVLLLFALLGSISLCIVK